MTGRDVHFSGDVYGLVSSRPTALWIERVNRAWGTEKSSPPTVIYRQGMRSCREPSSGSSSIALSLASKRETLRQRRHKRRDSGIHRLP